MRFSFLPHLSPDLDCILKMASVKAPFGFGRCVLKAATMLLCLFGNQQTWISICFLKLHSELMLGKDWRSLNV